MKNVFFFIVIILLFGSLKKGEKPCNPSIISSYYKNGKLVNIQKSSREGFYIAGVNKNYTSLITGKSFSCDSISIKIE